MATRATYGFDDDVYFYIHFDGYPSGAAEYFKQALEYDKHKDFKLDLAMKFFNANDEAIPTKNHKTHGDTEYYYDVYGKNENAKIIACKSNGKCFFNGKLSEFIKRAEEYENI